MKRNIRIDLPNDFRQLCEIFGFRPEDVIQEFVRRISLPRYLRDPEDRHRWANLFFLDYMDHLSPDPVQHTGIHDKYSDLLTKKVDDATNSRQREKATREVMRQWQKAVRQACDNGTGGC